MDEGTSYTQGKLVGIWPRCNRGAQLVAVAKGAEKHIKTNGLERRIRVLYQGEKIWAEPLSCIWRRLQGIGYAAEKIISRRAGIGGAVGLSRRFDP